ncbi:MAG: RNB domain-containing ribonuclease [Chthonomonadales bacterium]|nr:RNB domain-containing ribonuclease [Chthonomonadales bacterium]
MGQRNHSDEVDLIELARQAMRERGLEPDYSPEAIRQVLRLEGPATADGDGTRDLTSLPWASIDNDDSRDLDQLTLAEDLGDGNARVLVAVADVDAAVRAGSAVDSHAAVNTTSVYTPAIVFHMLPERLSTDLTSLVQGEERLAVVAAYEVAASGLVGQSEVYRARVVNHAKLAYRGVSAWLDGESETPDALAAAPGVAEQLRLQDAIAARLRKRRHEHGALDLETIEPRAEMRAGRTVALAAEAKTRAHGIIEDFMIAANGVTARFLSERGFPTFRRVVRSPERWDRLEELAAEYGVSLPPDPDPLALNRFLVRRREADPLRFPDLSLTVVKLMGAGEYAVQAPDAEAVGHFGLAVRDYAHSTAPNRRYPDVITQRLLKAAIAGLRCPLALADLEYLAGHCTQQEDAAKKVERRMRKSAAAQVLEDRIGEHFDALVTGSADKGTWVRLLDLPVEGRLVTGERRVDVGDRIRVKLLSTDVRRGYIDFGYVAG